MGIADRRPLLSVAPTKHHIHLRRTHAPLGETQQRKGATTAATTKKQKTNRRTNRDVTVAQRERERVGEGAGRKRSQWSGNSEVGVNDKKGGE